MNTTGTSASRRGFLAGGLALGGAALLVACSQDDPAPGSSGGTKKPELEKLTYMTAFGMTVSYASVLVAKSAGYFEKHGLDVAIQPGNGDSQGIQQVVSGQVQCCRVAALGMINGISKGAGVMAIGTIQQTGPFHLISSAAKPIKAPQDMKGRTIGIVSVGGSTEADLKIMLAREGLDAKDVKTEVVGNAPTAFALIDKGRIDAYIASVDTLKVLQGEKAALHEFKVDAYAPHPGDVLITTKELAQAGDKRVQSFMTAVVEGMNFVLDDKEKGLDETLKLLADFDIATLKTPDQAKAALISQTDLWVANGRDNILKNDPTAWDEGQKYAAAAGVIPKALPLTDLFTNRFLG